MVPELKFSCFSKNDKAENNKHEKLDEYVCSYYACSIVLPVFERVKRFS